MQIQAVRDLAVVGRLRRGNLGWSRLAEKPGVGRDRLVGSGQGKASVELGLMLGELPGETRHSSGS